MNDTDVEKPEKVLNSTLSPFAGAVAKVSVVPVSEYTDGSCTIPFNDTNTWSSESGMIETVKSVSTPSPVNVSDTTVCSAYVTPPPDPPEIVAGIQFTPSHFRY